MLEDNEGFRYPKIDQKKCIDCGLCRNVCPNSHIPEKFELNKFVFGGYNLDSKTRYNSTSGGAFSAIAGNIVMPVLFIITLAMLFRHFRDNPFVERFFMGVRPAVVALIAAPVFRLAQSAKVTWATCWIPILAALLIWLFDVSPILVILAAVVLGFVYGRMKKQ
jgi:chromate transporter